MKILQLCKKFPYPLKDGESLAVTYLSKALNELGCEVTLLSMNTTKHFCDLTALPNHYNHYTAIHTALVDNRIRWKDAFLNLFSKQSYHVSRFVSKEFQTMLIRLLKTQNFDVIQLETLYLAPYLPIIRKYSQAPIVMRAHNIEHEIWERVADNSQFIPLKWYLKLITNKLKKYEIARLQDYDLLVAITKRDLNLYRKLGYKKSAVVTPVGIDGKNYIPNYETFQQIPSISFIGALDWIPNQEALEWFLQKVWLNLHTKYPKLTLHIAGRNAPKSILNLHIPQVVVHGEVADAKAFINQHPIMIVPLLSGSGIRVKILEGMALGRVVITTSIGLEGINAMNGREIMVADSAEAFANCIETCLEHHDKLEKIGQQARKLIEYEFDNLHIAKKLLKSYKKLLEKAESNSKNKVAKVSM
ncbi:MAG: glycosyltransferase [Saprospiraceae bacterium]|nr:glycosyltransferase [Saprospiraceae bacterium]